MPIVDPQNFSAAAQGFGRLPLVRQFALLVGLAASISIGVAVALWSREPNYQLLYGSLAQKDVPMVLDALQKENIDFTVDEANGAVMVAGGQLRKARLSLAQQGLPKGAHGIGFEMLNEQQGFGTSQFMEAARYQRALEGELARTIMTINNVRGARVHLAIPKQSSFIRDRRAPSASVVVDLYPGHELRDEQTAGIVHLLASSVPNLEPDGVSVVDQAGRLINSQRGGRDLAMTAHQFSLTQRLEQGYIKRIEDILTPIAGVGRVRAQVVADLDFTMKEQTEERFDSEKPALRSEQTQEEKSSGYTGAVGVPGALSNQPPVAATAVGSAPAAAESPPPVTGDAEDTGAVPATPPASAAAAEETTPKRSSRRATHNYELDKTISHTRHAAGSIRRLSVAVVLDNKQVVGDDGVTTLQPYTEQELERLTALTKEAVGYNEARGDSVRVVNAAFVTPPAPAPLPEPPLWEEPWLWDVLKQVLGGALVLLITFGVLRPMLRSLAEKGREPAVQFAGPEGGQLAQGEASASLAAPQPPKAPQYQDDLATTKGLATQDPKRVAQVIKTWVATDGR